jgi:hypothetical protein
VCSVQCVSSVFRIGVLGPHLSCFRSWVCQLGLSVPFGVLVPFGVSVHSVCQFSGSVWCASSI